MGAEVAEKLSQMGNNLKSLSLPLTMDFDFATLRNLIHLKFTDVDSQSLDKLVREKGKSFSKLPRLLELSFTGPAEVVSTISASQFEIPSSLKYISLSVTQSKLIGTRETIAERIETNKREASMTPLPGFPGISLTIDDSYTSAQLNHTICSAPASVFLEVEFVGTGIPAILPDCLLFFSSLKSVTLRGMRITDYTVLPSGLLALEMHNMVPDPDNRYSTPSTAAEALRQIVGSFSIFSSLEKLWILESFKLPKAPFPASAQHSALEELQLSYCNLTGALPSSMFSNMPALQTLGLENNDISGALPTTGWTTLQFLFLGHNSIESWTIADPIGDAPSRLRTMGLSYNRLTTLPSDEAWAVMNSLRTLDLSFNPTLSTQMPAFAFDLLPNGAFTYDLSNCRFTGALRGTMSTDFSLSRETNRIMDLKLNNNNFTEPPPVVWTAPGQLPGSTWSNASLRFFDLRHNPLMRGEIWRLPFANNLYFSDTRIDGSMPLFLLAHPSETITNLDPGPRPLIDWCTNATTTMFNSSCFIPASVCSTGCPEAYAKCSKVFPPLPSSFECKPCSGSAPSSAFQCILGYWIASESILVTPGSPLILPSNPVVVDGNFSSDGQGSLLFRPGSTLYISGCIQRLGGLTIQLTDTDLQKLAKEIASGKGIRTLLASNATCPDSIDASRIPIKLSSSKSCRVASAKATTGSDARTLSVVFSVDSSKCNRWWIIVVAVLGGIIIIAFIVIIVLVLTVPRVRQFFRPYSKDRVPRSVAA